ncbi:hypothetical protein D3C86_1630640 [compost metagenome]
MRVKTLLKSFLPQCQALMHAKTVLLIDDHQCKAVKLYLLLENGVSADNHLYLTAGDGFLLCHTRFAFLLPGKPADFNTKRCKPVAEVIGVLFGQQFGRSH